MNITKKPEKAKTSNDNELLNAAKENRIGRSALTNATHGSDPGRHQERYENGRWSTLANGLCQSNSDRFEFFKNSIVQNYLQQWQRRRQATTISITICARRCWWVSNSAYQTTRTSRNGSALIKSYFLFSLSISHHIPYLVNTAMYCPNHS